jgi:hypothetical protein
MGEAAYAEVFAVLQSFEVAPDCATTPSNALKPGLTLLSCEQEMQPVIDTSRPETFGMQLSKGKRAMLERERQVEIDRENAILLEKAS